MTLFRIVDNSFLAAVTAELHVWSPECGWQADWWASGAESSEPRHIDLDW